MNIQGLSPQQAAVLQNPELRKSVLPGKGQEAAKRDPVEISSKAVENDKARPEMAASLRANALPESREERIELARKRVEEGYYDQPEVQEELANKLAQMVQGGGRPPPKNS